MREKGRTGLASARDPLQTCRVKTQSLIIDCDPGVDDAVGLFLAFAASELELLAITTVGGNVPVSATSRNARIMRQIAGREDVPVYAGADWPLVREPAGAGEFHGAEGLGDLTPFEPDAPLAEGHAVEAIIGLVMARPAGPVVVGQPRADDHLPGEIGASGAEESAAGVSVVERRAGAAA